MALLVAVTLIILGILFLALKGVFGGFPDSWGWVGIILAAVGLAMATPSIFQKLWGRPILKHEFERGAEGKDRFLAVHLKNPPVRNRILRILGVRRDSIQSLTVSFRIIEYGSGKILDPVRQAILYSDEYVKDGGRYRIALPPTYSVGANFIIAIADADAKRVFVPQDRLRTHLLIPPGYYQVVIAFMVDGEPIKVIRQFKVGKKADDLVWAKP
jgi:hypothetical protein